MAVKPLSTAITNQQQWKQTNNNGSNSPEATTQEADKDRATRTMNRGCFSSFPIVLSDQINDAVKEANFFKLECFLVGKEVEHLLQLFCPAAGLSTSAAELGLAIF
ncbi:hypothetical protein ABFS83_12G057700 [Erythranthe nasuta]